MNGCMQMFHHVRSRAIAAIAVIAFPSCTASHTVIYSGGIWWKDLIRAGKMRIKVHMCERLTCNIVISRLKFDVCRSRFKMATATTPHQDLKYPHRVKVGACPIT